MIRYEYSMPILPFYVYNLMSYIHNRNLLSATQLESPTAIDEQFNNNRINVTDFTRITFSTLATRKRTRGNHALQSQTYHRVSNSYDCFRRRRCRRRCRQSNVALDARARLFPLSVQRPQYVFTHDCWLHENVLAYINYAHRTCSLVTQTTHIRSHVRNALRTECVCVCVLHQQT